MKNKSIRIIIPIILIISACGMPQEPNIKNPGTISISVAMPVSRDLSSGDSTPSSGASDVYEALVYNDSYYSATPLDIESGPTYLTLEAGSYTVIVLAGCASGSRAVMLGSGYRQTVSVSEGAVTNVPITLTSISHTFSVPETAVCSSQYTITVSGNTEDPLLNVSSGGTAMDNKPYLEIGADANNLYLTCQVNGGEWSGTIELTAPALADQTNIKLFGSNIKLVDPLFSIDSDLCDLGGINWSWPNNSIIADSLEQETEKTVSFLASGTGIGVTVSWD